MPKSQKDFGSSTPRWQSPTATSNSKLEPPCPPD
jgi:hypothetical protein